MDYKEFDKIRYFLSFMPSKNNQNVVFYVNRKDPHGIAEEKRKMYQEKYANIPYIVFKKEYDFHLPEFNRRKHRREILINEFKAHKPEDFTDIPLDKKLDYLDAFSLDFKNDDEEDRNYKDSYDNLIACLWSISPSDEFLAEERRKLTHFMDVLEDKNFNDVWRAIDLLEPKLQKLASQHFLDAFSQAYKVDRIPVNYYTPKDQAETRSGYATPGKWGINIREDKKWSSPFELMGILFHESTHLRQDIMYEENSERYRIFTPEYGKIQNFVHFYYGKDKSHQIYELDPRESHAYYIERHFEDMANDRIFNGRLAAEKVPSYMARTLWFDYQR